MEPGEIWDLIVKADEKVKYATDERAGIRVDQARALLDEALRAAEAIGNDGLADQARTRLQDLAADD
ncbi:MAG: hypothetical protein WD004_04990 [Actinomycetota bacterium]